MVKKLGERGNVKGAKVRRTDGGLFHVRFLPILKQSGDGLRAGQIVLKILRVGEHEFKLQMNAR